MTTLTYTDGNGTHVDIVITKYSVTAKIRETGQQSTWKFFKKTRDSEKKDLSQSRVAPGQK